MKTYLKTLWRTFTRHITRLISVALMVLVSVGFIAGIGMSTEKMSYSLSDYYKSRNTSDFIVRGADGKFEEVQALFGPENVEWGGILEFEDGEFSAAANGTEVTYRLDGAGEGMTRLYVRERSVQNIPEIIGEAPLSEEERPDDLYEVSFEHKNPDQSGLLGFDFGEELTLSLNFGTMKIAGCTLRLTAEVLSPLHFAEYDDPSMKEIGEDEYENLKNIIYIDVTDHPLPALPFVGGPLIPMNEIYISSPKLKEHTLFSAAYEHELEEERKALEEVFSEEIEGGTAGILTLKDNFTYASFDAYEGKIRDIGYVLTVVFLLVTLLVVLSTMTRMLDEERAQIACLQTLGYPPARMLSKYLLFALVGTAIGGVGAYFASIGLSYVIYINFSWNYVLPPYSPHAAPLFFLLSAALVLAATLLATVIAGLKMTRTQPAVLLRPKSPKAGRKVFLEHIPFLWNRLSFKYKSTMRNVLRYQTRFWMTAVAVMASTALVLAGLAVLDACLFQEIGTAAMIGVGVIVLLFAALLNAVVIYTLTNINISERVRELATLMVLGYHDREVVGYVYREIYITSAVGIVLGIPFGALLCFFVFSMIEFGSLAAMGWYTWIVAPLMSLLFTFLVSLMLRRRIVKIDMNDSLKAIE